MILSLLRVAANFRCPTLERKVTSGTFQPPFLPEVQQVPDMQSKNEVVKNLKVTSATLQFDT